MVVVARNVSFAYSKNKVLNNVNLHIPRGAIYALLGPSGCGKTTFLRVITGQLSLKKNNGEVLIFGKKPFSATSLVPGPDIGFMSQDLALHELLTIEETLCFFGMLCGMKRHTVSERIEELCQMLELPKRNRLVNTLSGGQQRRVSLAVTLMHQPPLLILDEPTVGVDPMLRKIIWSYLVRITATLNTTVVITTHYIDEAKDANLIGAMRNGELLVEANPVLLMNTLNCDNLETCFAIICRLNTGNDELQSLKDKLPEPSFPEMRPESERRLEPPDFKSRQKALIKRNLILSKRNLYHLAFEIFLPFIEMIFLCFTLAGGLTDLPIAVVNEEGSNALAQKFVNHLDSRVLLQQNLSYNDAIESVRNGENYALIRLRKDFTECFDRKIELNLDVDNETLLCGSVLSQFDLTNQQIYYVAYSSLLNSYQTFNKEVLSEKNISTHYGSIPLDMSKPLFGSANGNSGEHFIGAFIPFLIYYFASVISVLKLMEDKKNGVEGRLWISRVSKSDLLISHFLANLFKVVLQSIIVLIYCYVIHGLSLKGSFWPLGLLAISQSISGFSQGFFLSSLFEREAAAWITGNAIMIANLFVSGVFWPIEAMSIFFRSLTKFFILTMPILAFRDIAIKGSGFQDTTVQLAFLSTYVWFFIFVALALLKARFSR